MSSLTLGTAQQSQPNDSATQEDAAIGQANNYLKGVVLYTDGGCRPTNPGYTGWGCHGYTYTTAPSNIGTGLQKHIPTSSGYKLAIHKDRLASHLVTPVKYIDFLGSSLTKGTNNLAEVDAILYSLEHLKGQDFDRVHIMMDSEYARRGLLEWSPVWAKNNWMKHDGREVPNAESWKKLIAVIEDLRAKQVELKLEWVKGHSDDLGNNIADRLATIGVMYSQDHKLKHDFKFSAPGGYWKSDVDRHPFLNFRRIYFNSVQQHNVPGRYFQAEPGGKEMVFGRKPPDTSYSIVQLYTPDPVIEAVKQRQFEVSNDINSVMVMQMDELYSDTVHPYLEEHGKCAMTTSHNRADMNLFSLNKRPITSECNPAGLSLRAVECCDLLEDLLERFKSEQESPGSNASGSIGFEVHNLTDTFYSATEVMKKKTAVLTYALKPEFVVGLKDLKVTVNVMCGKDLRSVPVPLILGTDLLPRNNLKRIESLHPEVYLLTWKEAECSIRYACVVKTDSGIGIWSNFYANRIFVSTNPQTT